MRYNLLIGSHTQIKVVNYVAVGHRGHGYTQTNGSPRKAGQISTRCVSTEREERFY